MTIRFAGAKGAGKSPLAAWRCRSVTLCPANDNARADRDHAALAAALRHFAEHGLSAAEKAGSRALLAHEAGDAAQCRQWLSLCRQFDPRLAQRLAVVAHAS